MLGVVLAALARHNAPQLPRPQPANDAERGTATARPRGGYATARATTRTTSTNNGVDNMEMHRFKITFNDGEIRYGEARDIFDAAFAALSIRNAERKTLTINGTPYTTPAFLMINAIDAVEKVVA